MKYLTLLLTAAAFVAGCGLYTACKTDCPTQPPPIVPWHNLLQLKATQVSIRWTQLQWHNDSIAVSHYYVLLRNNKDTVYADSVYYRDSVVTIKDSGLQPGTPYTYTLYRVYNKQPWDTASVAITTLAITDPNMTMTSHVFGSAGSNSYLRGIWASSPTDVWMCGFIDNSNSGGGVYDIIHYDGTTFQLSRQGGTLEGVYGVDSGDVWFAGGSGGCYVEHYLAGNWTQYDFGDTTILGHSVPGGILQGIYATPDKQWVYAVGTRAGLILRLNRVTNKWEEMQCPFSSQYSFGFLNIIGFGDNDIYALGATGSDNGTGGVVHWDGAIWSILTQASATPNGSTSISGSLNGIGGYSPDSLYIVGDSIYHRSGSNWLNVPAFSGDRTFSDDISATAWNRVFVCGDDQLLYWNGEKWYYEDPGGSTRLERVFALDNVAYVVGWEGAFFGIIK